MAQGFNAKETRFQGKYDASLLNTLHQAYPPFLYRTLVLLILGWLGRLALLGNTNLIGIWVDSLCHEGPACKPVPAIFANVGTTGFLKLLGAATFIGFLFSLAY